MNVTDYQEPNQTNLFQFLKGKFRKYQFNTILLLKFNSECCTNVSLILSVFSLVNISISVYSYIVMAYISL